MIFEIKHRFSGAILFSMETKSLKLCVEAAIKLSANLRYADLRSADLQSADLQSANLRSADLQSANLQSANLRYADLQSADLRSADLQSANLRSADLQSADLQSADLLFANLQSADLLSAKNADYAIACTRILPEGDLIGWKKAGGKIVKLRVPADAKRSSAFGRKCRAEFVDVMEIEGATEVTTDGCGNGVHTVYRVGDRVTANGWNEDFTQECAQGIHFFITRIEAENF